MPKRDKLFTMYLRLLLIFTLVSGLAHSKSWKDMFTWSEIKGRVITEIENMDLDIKVDAVDTNLAKGLGLRLKYLYNMQPSYMQNKYMRTDKYSLDFEINPGDWFANSSPIFLNLKRGSQIYFVRNFDSQKKAGLALPYTHKNIPTNAVNTLERLQPGDFYSAPVVMTLNVGAQGYYPTPVYKAGALVSLAFSGEFILNIYRVDEKRVRVKLVTATRRTTHGSVEINNVYDFTGVGLINDAIEGALYLDLAKVFNESALGEQYIVDYTFDLTNELAQEAYNQIINPRLKVKVKDFINQFKGIEFFENKVVSDFSLAEKLHKNNNGVVRNFKGFNRYKFKKKGIELELLISKLKRNQTYYKNKITVEDAKGDRRRFFFPNKVVRFYEKLNLGSVSRKDEMERSYFGLVPMEDEFKGQKYSDLGITIARRDKFFTDLEWRKEKQRLKDLLPKSVISKIDFTPVDTLETRKKFKIDLQILFKEDALSSLKNITLEEIHAKIDNLMREREHVKLTKLGKLMAHSYLEIRNSINAQKSSVKSLSKKIFNILSNSEYDATKRVEKFIDLTTKNLFSRYGVKAILELLEERGSLNKALIDLQLVANEMKPIQYRVGNHKLSKMYQQVLLINSELHDPSRDMRVLSSGKTISNHN